MVSVRPPRRGKKKLTSLPPSVALIRLPTDFIEQAMKIYPEKLTFGTKPFCPYCDECCCSHQMTDLELYGTSTATPGPNKDIKKPRPSTPSPKELPTEETFLCKFCLSNAETAAVFRSHNFTDDKGTVTCPILRALVCPRCGGTGDNAHTLKYCPTNTDTDKKNRHKHTITRNAFGKKVVRKY